MTEFRVEQNPGPPEL